MEFHSLRFFAFLLAVLALHYSLPRPLRRYLLLVASYVFYGAWDWRFCGLIAASTALDWYVALRIAACDDTKRRKAWLVATLAANLGMLAVFKYLNFGIASFCALTGMDPESHLLPIVLPPGISFFTFQSMSYTIDVYRGHIAPRRRLVDFALFIAFFPQLVAGPIIKAIEFFPTFDRWRRPTDGELQRGLMLILLGLIEKAVFADHLAPYVEAYFGAVAAHPGWLPAVTGVLAFGLQIFFDFAGYSDIAIGTALLFGFRFPANFERPYLAGNVAEFWHRWHISLSTWLREYLYIPLGGNRGGAWRTCRNLMLTMLLGGLWHGASWTFVIWGGLHGAYLLVHRLWRAHGRKHLSERCTAQPLYRLVCWLLTLYAVGLAWAFFRAGTLTDALAVARALLLPQHLGASVLPVHWLPLVGGVLVVALLQEHRALLDRIDRASVLLRGCVFAGLLIVLTVFAVTDQHVAFIYFQF